MFYVTFFHLCKFGRRIEYVVHVDDAETFRINLLEESANGNIGDVFYIDESGKDVKLDYYN